MPIMTRKMLLLGCAALAAVALTGCVGAERSTERMGGVWGYIAAPSSALIECATNQLDGDVLTVDRVRSPERAWLVVRPSNPAYNVVNGIVEVPADETRNVKVGEYNDLRVDIEPVELSDWLEISVHTDVGVLGTYEYLFKRPFDYPDRIYKTAGIPVSQRIWVGEGEKPYQPPGADDMGM